MDGWTDGRTDGQTDGVTALLDLLSPLATQVKTMVIYDRLIDRGGGVTTGKGKRGDRKIGDMYNFVVDSSFSYYYSIGERSNFLKDK